MQASLPVWVTEIKAFSLGELTIYISTHLLLSVFFSLRSLSLSTAMVSVDAARTVIGIIGNVISFFLFLSPLPTFIQIWRKRSVEQYSPVPYLATLINCMVWTLYGLPLVHPGSTLVITINGFGVALELVYIAVFLFFSDGKKRLTVLLVMLVEIIFITLLTLVVLLFAHTHSRRSLIVGSICILFNIMMYASPLAVMKLVITTKSVEYMPLSLSLASVANGVAWTIYACLRFDPFITVPNGLGLLFGLAQLILYATYYRSTKRLIAERKAKTQIALSEIVVGGDTPEKKVAAT